MKQAKSGFISEMQSVISSILGARDMVFDNSKLGPKTELLGCFAGSVILAKDSTIPEYCLLSLISCYCNQFQYTAIL